MDKLYAPNDNNSPVPRFMRLSSFINDELNKATGHYKKPKYVYYAVVDGETVEFTNFNELITTTGLIPNSIRNKLKVYKTKPFVLCGVKVWREKK